MSAPPAQPSFDFGPPPSPPPVHSPPGQRRFNFLFVGVTILVAIALVGGLLLYSHRGRRVTSNVDSTAAVRQAFVNYYSALAEAYKQLSVTPLQGHVTSAALQKEKALLTSAVQSGSRYQLTAQHNLQIVVYGERDLASVDDILVRHTTPLDASQKPSGPETNDILHISYGFTKLRGQWFLDSMTTFGGAVATSDLPVSYAAILPSVSIPSGAAASVARAYLNYWDQSRTAFGAQDPSVLASVESDPELTKEEAALEKWRQENLVYRVVEEHNYRIGFRDPATAYVYDTLRDASYLQDESTGKAVPGTPASLVRQVSEVKLVDGAWKIDLASSA